MRKLLAPAIASAVMLAVLLGLGFWQYERMGWKERMLADISAAESRPAIPLPADPPQFAKVRVEGIFRPDLAVLYGADGRMRREGPVMGAQLIVPLERPGADPILVVRGWVPALPAAQPAGPVTVEGYARQPEKKGWFVPPDDFATRHVYTLDAAAIAQGIGLKKVAPFIIVALGPVGETIPEPAHALPRPANNHFSYVVTWFGLAFVLVVMFIFYARKVLRPS